MSVEAESFTVNLNTYGDALYTYETSFTDEFEIGQVTLTCSESSASSLETESPVTKGIIENYEIWLRSAYGRDYDCLLTSGSFNGRRYITWAPTARIYGYETLATFTQIQVRIHNRHSYGEIFGTVAVNTIA